MKADDAAMNSWQCDPNDWLNSFAFQPVSNLARSIRLASDGRVELAFGCNQSVGPAFRVPDRECNGDLTTAMSFDVCHEIAPADRACGNSSILIFSPLKAEGDGRATTGGHQIT